MNNVVAKFLGYQPSWEEDQGRPIPCPLELKDLLFSAWQLLNVSEKKSKKVLSKPLTYGEWRSIATVVHRAMIRIDCKDTKLLDGLEAFSISRG